MRVIWTIGKCQVRKGGDGLYITGADSQVPAETSKACPGMGPEGSESGVTEYKR